MAQDTHRTLADMLDSRDYERAKTPKIVGNYRVGKTIGSGAFCKVKTATHLLTKEKFAIKILQPQAPQNWAEVEREIEILRQIQHPNIIRIHDVLWSENKGFIHKFVQFNEVRIQAVKIYIIVELAQGGELWHHISKKGPIDEELCRKFFRQMVSGLEYCHMHLICHRDLKLENILLDNQNNIKINDFGLSNFIRPGHSMHTFCGTLAYAAPEILSQQAYVGFFVDIWSLGIILFAMLTGDVPWALDDEERKTVELSNLLAGKFRLPVGIVLSRECISLLQIMLQPNPKNRATLAQIRTHPWTNKGFNEPPARVFENYPPVLEIEEPIIQQIALLGLNAGKARKSILSNEPCPALCLYHTLLKKQLATKKLLPALVRSAGEPRSPPSNRFASLSVSSAPSPSTPFDMVDDSDDFESRIENSLHDDSDAHNFLQPIDKREKKTKTSSAPSTPTAATAPAFPVYPTITPTITPTTLPPTTPLPNTAPRSPIFTLTSPRSTTIETRRKILTDNPPSNKIYLEPISPTPSRTPPPLSPPSSRTPIALPPPSSPSRVSPTTSASPSSPVFPSASPKRSSGSPKSSSSSPKTPHHKEREAPFGNSNTGTTTTTKGDHVGETRITTPSTDEGDEKKKPMFKSLLSKLRGSKLAPLEV